MAAESYLDGGILSDILEVQSRLQLGNNASRSNGYGGTELPEKQVLPGATRLTPAQVDAFLNRYEIRDHHANDATGFSATLIFDKQTQQFNLAFRSTEFACAGAGCLDTGLHDQAACLRA